MGKKKKKTKQVRDQPQRITKKRNAAAAGANITHLNKQEKTMDTSSSRKKIVNDDIVGRRTIDTSQKPVKAQVEKRSTPTVITDKDSVESGGISDDTIF